MIMTIRVVAGDNADIVLGGTWTMTASAGDEPTAEITLPDGSTEAMTIEAGSASGFWVLTYATTQTGMHSAVLADSTDRVGAVAHVAQVTTASGMPNIADLDVYLGTHSYTDDDLVEALDAETQQQRDECRVPAAYPANLRSALLRRAQYHLAMKRVQLGVIQGDADRDPIRVGSDPEIRRLERSHRRLPAG